MQSCGVEQTAASSHRAVSGSHRCSPGQSPLVPHGAASLGMHSVSLQSHSSGQSIAVMHETWLQRPSSPQSSMPLQSEESGAQRSIHDSASQILPSKQPSSSPHGLASMQPSGLQSWLPGQGVLSSHSERSTHSPPTQACPSAHCSSFVQPDWAPVHCPSTHSEPSGQSFPSVHGGRQAL